MDVKNRKTVSIDRLDGGGTVAVATVQLRIGENQQRYYEVRPRVPYHIRVRGVTFAPASVDLRGYNYFPSEVLYGSGTK